MSVPTRLNVFYVPRSLSGCVRPKINRSCFCLPVYAWCSVFLLACVDCICAPVYVPIVLQTHKWRSMTSVLHASTRLRRTEVYHGITQHGPRTITTESTTATQSPVFNTTVRSPKMPKKKQKKKRKVITERKCSDQTPDKERI